MKKSILFINGNLSVGGVEMALVNLLNCIDISQYDVDLLLLQDGYDYEADIPKHINCIKFNLDEAEGPFLQSIIKNTKSGNGFCVNYRITSLLAKSVSPKFFRFLSFNGRLKHKYDAVIAFRPGICADLALYKVNSDLKICWWHHGDTNIGVPLSTINEQLRQFDKVVAVSTGVKGLLSDTFPDLASKVVVVHNIVDTDKIQSKAALYNPYQECKLSDKAFKIITVSRLSKEKNVTQAIYVAEILKQQGLNFHWHIVGDGNCRGEIDNLIHKFALESYITLAGNQPNPYPWIKGADLMVHLSPVESFGLVILEAMALGVPCIAVESIGAKELINDQNGILVKNDISTIANQIMHIIDEPSLRESHINNADRALQKFSSESIFQSFKHLVHDKTNFQ
ncbi:MAG: glycosyltransferase [Bacteroidales bacterium]|nr:glycosyltransferase [Bacteroidales bacterium]